MNSMRPSWKLKLIAGKVYTTADERRKGMGFMEAVKATRQSFFFGLWAEDVKSIQKIDTSSWGLKIRRIGEDSSSVYSEIHE